MENAEKELDKDYERIDISKATISKIKDQVYTGKALTPAVTVKLGKQVLDSKTDYTFRYRKNKAIGTATVTVTGKDKYTGVVKAEFKINPKAVKKFTVKLGKKKQTLALSWKKAGGVTGYQVQYSLKKNFKAKDKSTKMIRIKKAKTVKTTIKDLKLKKTYYVRIRAYKVNLQPGSDARLFCTEKLQAQLKMPRRRFASVNKGRDGEDYIVIRQGV